jgi:succinate-semialdehyde dehydrogenase/glutarate-semialdehyde dehydrogenase
MNLNLKDSSLLKTQAYIDGQWLDSDDGSTFAVDNPASGIDIAQVANCGVAETRRAIEAAERAMVSWRARTAKDRSVILRRWYELMMANQEDLAIIMTSEQGKTLAESRAEVAYGASFIEWFSEEAKRVYGDIIPAPQTDRRAVVIKQPVGVSAAITPWNFPNAMIARKAGPALAVGCSMVIKPASATPLSALAMAALAERAGVPAGVLSVVTGNNARAIGGELTANPTVRKLSFTGSTEIGKVLTKQCADTVKRTSMELGGNAPVIVFDDADLDAAVAGAAATKYRNSGQTCICANRLIVQDSVYDSFVRKLVELVRTFRIGDGLDENSTHGPLINEAAVQGVDDMVQDALSKGAVAVLGGSPSSMGPCYYDMTVLTHVSEDMRVAYFYTRDVGRAWRVSEAIEYGMVGVNEVAISSDVIPFGGVKESGQGREGSRYGIDDYLEIKYICMGGLED